MSISLGFDRVLIHGNIYAYLYLMTFILEHPQSAGETTIGGQFTGCSIHTPVI